MFIFTKPTQGYLRKQCFLLVKISPLPKVEGCVMPPLPNIPFEFVVVDTLHRIIGLLFHQVSPHYVSYKKMPLPYANPFLNTKWENKTLNINFMFFIIFIFIGCRGSCQQWLPQCPDRRNGFHQCWIQILWRI